MKFKPEDFELMVWTGNSTLDSQNIASNANRILKEWLDAAPTVYGGKFDTGETDSLRFHADSTNYPWDVTHKAKLVCIEPIGSKELSSAQGERE